MKNTKKATAAKTVRLLAAMMIATALVPSAAFAREEAFDEDIQIQKDDAAHYEFDEQKKNSSVFENETFTSEKASEDMEESAAFDPRAEVADTTSLPYSAICKLTMVFEDEAGDQYQFEASGYVVGASTIVTCAHSVYDLENSLGWVDAISIEPGVNGDQKPFTSYTTRDVRYIEIDPEWAQSGSVENDSAIIVLNENIARETGSLKLASTMNEQDAVSLSGYPSRYQGQRAAAVQTQSRAESFSRTGRTVEADLYATGGQSGAPILNEKNEVIGTYACSYSDSQRATGPAMDGERIAWIASYTATGKMRNANDDIRTFNELESPVYRVYNPNTGEHFYTMNRDERNTLVQLGWVAEGIAWTSCNDEDAHPVYRVYNPNTGDHHYTVDKDEYDALGKIGWQKEGASWMAAPQHEQKAEPVYRMYNPNATIGSHHFTDDANEAEALARLGWKNENVGFYVED